MTADADSRVIDLWGFVKSLWAQKWWWLATFAVVFGAGAAYAVTRPQSYLASQTFVIGAPVAKDAAEAIQQTNTLNGAASVLARQALSPPVADAVLQKHPELATVAGLRGRLAVVPVGNTLLEFQLTAPDAADARAIVRDSEESLRDALPQLLPAQAGGRLVATLSGEPWIAPVNNGRNLLLAEAFALAALLATVVAGILERRRRS